MTETVQILPTANPEWGAWGTATCAGYDAALVWEAASRALLDGLRGLTPAGARAILDGRWGRHWVDSLQARHVRDAALVRRHLLDTLAAWGLRDIRLLLAEVGLLPADLERIVIEDDSDPLDLVLREIVMTFLDVETFRVRGSDRLDFKELSVAQLGRALRAAFEAGVEFGKDQG